MPYLGNEPFTQYSETKTQVLTGNGTVGPYTLDYEVGSVGDVEVFVNNVRQQGGSSYAYTVSGNQLTMTGAVAASDDFYVVFQGNATPSGQIPEKQSNGDYNFDGSTLFVDASTNRVGVNTASPAHSFHVNNASMKVGSGDDTADARIIFESDSSMGDGWVGIPTWADDHFYLFGPNGSGGNEAFMDYDGTNEKTRFYTGGTERAFLDSNGNFRISGGLYVGGTGSANLLDDYEEGTFTAQFNAVTRTNTDTVGKYVKIGRMVFIQAKMTVSSIDNTDTSGVQFSLPFAHEGSTGGCFFSYDSSNTTLFDSNHSKIHGARITGSSCVLTEDNGTDVRYSDACQSSGTFRFALSYETT